MDATSKETEKTTNDCGGTIGLTENDDAPEVMVSLFDYSVENHFKAMDKISRLCGEEAEDGAVQESEIERLSSMIGFIREWRQYNCKPRIIKFASEAESRQGKDVVSGINLPQFSAALVPKGSFSGDTTSLENREDFVLYVGGSVWALDWCPRIRQTSDCHVSCELIAVSAHPPGSSYHKIGATLTGRGIVQIWCLLNNSMDEDTPPPVEKPKGRPRKNDCANDRASKPKRPRGRPRKNAIIETVDCLDCENQFAQSLGQFPKKLPKLLSTDGLSMIRHKSEVQEPSNKREKGFNQAMAACNNPLKTSAFMPDGKSRNRPIIESLDALDCDNQSIQPLAVQFPKNSCELFATDGLSMSNHNYAAQECPNEQEKDVQGLTACSSALKTPAERRRLKHKTGLAIYNDDNMLPLLTHNKGKESPPTKQTHCSFEEVTMVFSDAASKNDTFGISSTTDSIPKDVSLPRIMLCIAHNGKVAWDVKWRPSSTSDLEWKHRIGYLAVLLGNGSLEVWEVPSPHTIKMIYSSSNTEGTDPRFVKLEPVFRCSKLMFGGRQSIPLALEWSTFSPHDFILAGCHDGTVALWKFTANGSSKGNGIIWGTSDTRPLLRFRGDTVPIRALAWAPVEKDPESANVMVTAGHAGLKFWDIRDPFHPLLMVNPVQRVIYSVDWLSDPRCIILSFDDGTLRTLSITKASNDVAVTGKRFSGPQQPGFHCYSCSPFAIWSVQVSRTTGLVAYCCADGNVIQFQLTKNAVEKDASRYKAPHFLCGSLTEEDLVLTVNTPLPNTPFIMKKSHNQWGDTPRSIRGVSESNQAKRADNNQKSEYQATDDKPLYLCDDVDDSGVEHVSGNTKAASKIKQTTKSKSNSKKKVKQDQAELYRDGEPEKVKSKENEKEEGGNEVEVFPSKMVAMHRVRWNMNKGSERWLCYGGAAGIVRCQKIAAGLSVGKELAKR